MKQAQIECMFFSSLRLEWQQKQDAVMNSVDDLSLDRNDDACLRVKYSKHKTGYKMLLFWIFGIIIASSTVKGEEDFELKLDGNQKLQLELTGSQIKGNKDFTFTLLFKTIHPSGVLLWAFGKSGDNLLIEMIRGKLRYEIAIIVYCTISANFQAIEWFEV